MNKRELKKKIHEAYKSETPDLRSDIIAACEKEPQEPQALPITEEVYQNKFQFNYNTLFRCVAATAICLILFVSGITLGAFIQKDEENIAVAPQAAETVIYLDVNPSVELRIDNNNKIIEVVAANEDAKIVLADLELGGIDVNTALKAIVGSMYVNGYLTESSNSILISINSQNEQVASSLLHGVTEKISSVFENSEMECAIIAQCVNVDETLINKAEKYGVSVGKMHFLNKITDSFKGISEDALDIMSLLSINDLNLIYSQRYNADSENANEIIYGDAKINISSEEALENVLLQIGKTRDDVSKFRTFLRPSKGGNARIAYAVNIKLKGDSTIYRYEVDCQSGEVFEVMTLATLTSNGIVYRDVLFSMGNIPENLQ